MISLDPERELREQVLSHHRLPFARIKGRVNLLSTRQPRRVLFDFAVLRPGAS